jgi:hypothetical protein
MTNTPNTAATIFGYVIVGAFVTVMSMCGLLFLRALTAKLMTGKWPHQSYESRKIYRGIRG